MNTLLDFSRIEAGRAQASYRPTDLARLTADLSSCFRSACERAGLRLLVDCPPLPASVHVDRDMWEKIVLNLVSNGFKFTLEGEIEVKVRAAGDHCELTVRDTGIGIPEEELPRIFERFRRVEATRGRTLEGSGIGLALVDELVKLHGGSVQVRSVPGRGSAFTVIVPFGTAHLPAERLGAPGDLESTSNRARLYVEEALRWLPSSWEGSIPAELGARDGGRTATQGAPRPSGERLTVLLADDNADMRDYVGRLLGTLFEVEAVADGQTALEAARRRRPDLVLADVMMPRLDGFELLRELRAEPLLCTVPIILLSARAGEESRVEGLEAGADDYLVKPFSARELLARVTMNINLARVRQEVEHERTARTAAEAAERRSAFLAEAGSLLSESLDYEETLSRLSRLCVRSLADVCVLDLVEGTRIRRLAGACADPAKEPILARLRERHPARWDSPHPAASCLRTGRPVLISEFDAAALRAVCEDEDHVELARAIGTRSALAVPLIARGQTLGALSLSSSTPRRYGAADLELVQEVAQRAAIALENARLYREIQRADERKSEFIGILSHELRNPLAPLRTGLQLLRRSPPESPIAAHAWEIVERQTRHLTRLIDDLLDVTRISRGKIELQRSRIDVRRVVESTCDDLRPGFGQAEVVLDLLVSSDPLWVEADATRVSQVVGNLLQNAAKFTPRGGSVMVEVARRNGRAEISVRDTGVGIELGELERMFEPFAQGKQDLARTQGGLGLGLALAKGLVELHGGSIHARSEGLGHGSEFVVSLPLGV